MKMTLALLLTLACTAAFAGERSISCSVSPTNANDESPYESMTTHSAIQAPDQPTEIYTDSRIQQTVSFGDGYSVSFDFTAKVTDNPADDVLLLEAKLNRGESLLALGQEVNALPTDLDELDGIMNSVQVVLRNPQGYTPGAAADTPKNIHVICLVFKDM